MIMSSFLGEADKPDGSPGPLSIRRIATIMKKHGFRWGGDWKEKDYPHYEM
jgi:hypothetical protein